MERIQRVSLWRTEVRGGFSQGVTLNARGGQCDQMCAGERETATGPKKGEFGEGRETKRARVCRGVGCENGVLTTFFYGRGE